MCMKYVTDHFTLEMIKENKYNIKIKTLKKYQFKEKIKKAKSSINSNLIAKMLHKPKEKNNMEKNNNYNRYNCSNMWNFMFIF